MPDVCRAYDAYEAYEVWKGLFERTAGAFQRMGYELLPPPAGRSPSLEEGGLGGGEIESLQNVGGRAMPAPKNVR